MFHKYRYFDLMC